MPRRSRHLRRPRRKRWDIAGNSLALPPDYCNRTRRPTTDVDALVVIGYNDPDPAACAKKPLKEFPQWPSAENNTYVALSHSMYLVPSNDLAVEKIAKTPHPVTC